MGINTVVVIHNDSIYDIGNHPSEFVQEIIDKMHHFQGEAVHIFGGRLIDVLHSSATHMLAVGGNTGKVVHRTLEPSYHKKEDYIKILKEMAEVVGYRLVKK